MFSFAGDTVLDPFAGTGSTALGAIDAGRNSISPDIEPAYVEMARRNIENAARQVRLFGATEAEFAFENQRAAKLGRRGGAVHAAGKFESLFLEGPYRHRVSTHGDEVAFRFYEDLYDLRRSQAYKDRVDSGLCVLSGQNTRHGVTARRGDGSFGEIVPNVSPGREAGFIVQRGPIATIEIGIEVKILAKAMIKQIDRVVRDLNDQVEHFKSKGGRPITIGIAGINHAPQYLS